MRRSAPTPCLRLDSAAVGIVRTAEDAHLYSRLGRAGPTCVCLFRFEPSLPREHTCVTLPLMRVCLQCGRMPVTNSDVCTKCRTVLLTLTENLPMLTKPTQTVHVAYIPQDGPALTLKVLPCKCGSSSLDMRHVGNLEFHGAYYIRCTQCNLTGPVITHRPNDTPEHKSRLRAFAATMWDKYIQGHLGR